MKIKCITIGKTQEKEFKVLIDNYIGRISHYAPFEYLEIPALKNTAKLSTDLIKKAEGDLFFKQINASDFIILLDDKGKMFSSMQFSNQIEKWNMNGINITFLIGGAYGFSEEIYQRSNYKLSLSLMTLTHQMVRLLFLEQLYRGFTILKGEKYHHE